MSNIIKAKDEAGRKLTSGLRIAAVARSGDPVAENPAGAVARPEMPPAEGKAGPVAADGRDDEIAALRAELAALRETMADELKRAEEKGRAEGMTQALRDEDARIDMLADALKEMQRQVEEALGQSERLALVVTQDLFAKLFAEPSLHRDLIEQAIARQYREIDRQLVRKVHVSRADFPDAAALAALGSHCPDVAIEHDDGLAAGQCRFDLRLGHLDLSLPVLNAELQRFLSALADKAEAD